MKTSKFLKLVVALSLVALSSLHAVDRTWDGDTNTTFSNVNNWVGGVAPANSTADVAIFADPIPTFQPTLTLSQLLGGITFSGAGAGGWNLGGTGLQLTFGAGNITSNNTSGTNTIDPNVLIGSGASAGTFTIGTGGTLRLAGSLLVNNTRTLAVNGGTLRVASLNSVAAGVGSFSTTGSGSIIIEGAAGGNLTVGTIIGATGAGSVLLGHQSALGSGDINLREASIGSTTDLIGATAVTNNAIYGNAGNGSEFIGSNSLEIAGTFSVTTNNSRTITNNISAGKQLILSGTVDLAKTVAGARTQTFRGTGDTLISGNIVSTAAVGSLAKNDAGILTLSGTNSYTGSTTITAGTLQLAKQVSLYNNNSANWTAANINVKSGATLALNVDSAGNAGFTSTSLNTLLTNISVAGSSSAGLQSGARLAFDTSTATGGTFTQGNVIANSTGASGGAISVTKLGTGTLVFDKANTYSGGTTVSVGTLLVNNSSGSGTGSGTVMVAVGAVLGGGDAAGTTGFITGATTINGSLRPGNSIGTLNVANSVTWNDNDAFVFELGTSAANITLANTTGTRDLLNITGAGIFTKGTSVDNTFTFDFAGTGQAGVYKIVDWAASTTFTMASDFVATNLASGLTGSFTIDNTTTALYLNVVPEPSTWALLAGSLTALVIFRRRRLA